MIKARNDLMGMKEICYYVARSESTVLAWIRDRDFPAKKIGGIWEASRRQVDKWKEDVLFDTVGRKKRRPRG